MNRHDDRRGARLRRLRRTRGAAMVEGVVAIPFFILMFAGSMFVGGFFHERLVTQSEARYETWKRAVSDSCDDGATGTLPGMTVVDSSDLGELSKTPLGALCDKDFGAITYSARSSYAVTGAVPFNKDIMATVMCPCNETAIAGDVAYEKAVEFLWDSYQHKDVLPQNAAIASFIDFSALFSFGIGGPMMY